MVTSRAPLDENQIGMLFNTTTPHLAPRWAAPLVFAPCGGAGSVLPCGGGRTHVGLGPLGNTALQEGRAGMVPGKGAGGESGDARFELGPTPLTPRRPPTTAHAPGSRATPQFDDGPAPGISRGTGECAPRSGAVQGSNATRVVSYTCSPLRARM